MEGKQNEVVLFGTWASAFCTIIELALKLKGIPYAYVEEDLGNKSELLLAYNPVHKKVIAGFLPIITTKGKEQEKAIEDMVELIKVFEEGMKKDFPGKFPFFNGGTWGLVDIIVGSNACNYKVFHEVVSVVVISHENNHDFFKWVHALKDHSLMKETLPPHEKMVAKMRQVQSTISSV
ncbi:hypothetical protein FNV43_RR26188 [Rhamnella rubrinervis]|uniref:Glutathione S-transferase n=1 Tax=Rhamnella rubrinervis TaxID=2594499 RepID=A0A8K0GJE3_9ROSA|nr:hypothetical protein FNV43_RR26188 [Rhamnella rubrinervis]